MVMATSRAVVEPFVQVIEVVMSSSVRSATPFRSVFALTNPLGSICLRLSVVKVDSHRNMKVCAVTASPSESLFSDFFFLRQAIFFFCHGGRPFVLDESPNGLAASRRLAVPPQLHRLDVLDRAQGEV